MKRALFFLFLLTSATHASDWFEGENFLVEPPSGDVFDTYTKEESGWSSTMWQSKERGGKDTYVVNILSGKPPKLSTFRVSQDKPGEEACDEFTSKIIDDSERNGYDSVLWETSCNLRGSQIHSIQLAVAGRDSLYHVRKLWKLAISDEEVSEWREIMSEISLCDTRQESQSCPEGFSKVDDS